LPDGCGQGATPIHSRATRRRNGIEPDRRFGDHARYGERSDAGNGGERERRTVIGSPQVVKDGIEALAAEHGEDEALIVNIVYDHSAASGRIN
jgi:alkanesulfonate monooxygenase SsuD/methylene tetrahydromethanopterin reductase-like flavin-dependent oxidoreductase (luciferase family)